MVAPLHQLGIAEFPVQSLSFSHTSQVSELGPAVSTITAPELIRF